MHTKGWKPPGHENLVHTKYSGSPVSHFFRTFLHGVFFFFIWRKLSKDCQKEVLLVYQPLTLHHFRYVSDRDHSRWHRQLHMDPNGEKLHPAYTLYFANGCKCNSDMRHQWIHWDLLDARERGFLRQSCSVEHNCTTQVFGEGLQRIIPSQFILHDCSKTSLIKAFLSGQMRKFRQKMRITFWKWTWRKLNSFSKLAFRRTCCRRTSSLTSSRTCQPFKERQSGFLKKKKNTSESIAQIDKNAFDKNLAWRRQHPSPAPKFCALQNTSWLESLWILPCNYDLSIFI